MQSLAFDEKKIIMKSSMSLRVIKCPCNRRKRKADDYIPVMA